MKDGQVAESGSFSELMDEATGTGDFRTAYLVQASAFTDSLPGQRDATTDTKTVGRG